MIVESHAPTRISLFGGGTDMDSYFMGFGGLVVSLAINLRQHITIYTEKDVVKKSLNNIPPSGDINFMHKIFDEFNASKDNSRFVKMGNMHHVRFDSISDLPLESGMGASAAGAVATVGAIRKSLGLSMDKGEIAEQAWHIEVNKIGLFGGRQDQYASTYGGVNVFEFNKESVNVTPLGTNFIDKIFPSLVLLYIGKNRVNPKIQEGLRTLKPEQIQRLNEIKQIAIKSMEPIGQGDIEKVGHLLDRSWRVKQRSNKGGSEPWINSLYEKEKKNGALGGKLCGAGGGGFMIYIVKPNHKEEFITKMNNEGLTQWDFSICWNGLETKILNTTN